MSIPAFYNGLTVTEYTIHSNKISDAVKIVLLTDLHSCEYGKSQQTLIEKTDEQNPDLILMSGDIMDDVFPDSSTVELLKVIAYKYPCYYVTGNHECRSGRVKTQKNIFRVYGVTVLEGDCKNVSVNGQHILICGVDDPQSGKEIFDKQLSNVSELINAEQYSILLSHRPELFERYVSCNFDLVLSGHAHGGQWRIPRILPHGLYAPYQGLFPKYTTGIYEKNGTKMLVSRGLSRESPRVPRIFNAPELVVILLSPQ
ncbi:MAG: metallophosphoesterase [Oscillospiraceae bacterium]|nr:metallophosphoesterase [Oscillospiraceae bacterium]